jgi:hypothetical protein
VDAQHELLRRIHWWTRADIRYLAKPTLSIAMHTVGDREPLALMTCKEMTGIEFIALSALWVLRSIRPLNVELL